MKSGKTGRAGSENKTFKDYTILYMYLAQGQGQITPGDNILIATKSFTTLIIHGKFQSLHFKTF